MIFFSGQLLFIIILSLVTLKILIIFCEFLSKRSEHNIMDFWMCISSY